MAFLAFVPLGLFALLAIMVGGVLVAVERAERRRARRFAPRRAWAFRPVVIAGGKVDHAAPAEPPAEQPQPAAKISSA